MNESSLFSISIFRLLGYQFFQFALLGGVITAVTCAIIGLFVILRKEAMIGDGVAHTSLGGIAIGVLLGIEPLLTALATSIVAVLTISYMRKRGLAQTDSATAVILATGFSAGLIIISFAGGFNVELFSFLFGSILTIDATDLFLMCVLGTFTVFFVALFYKELLSITFDEEAARLTGIPVGALSTAFNILVAVTIVLSIKVVGMILVTALLVLPGLTSLQLKLSFKKTALASIAFGVASVMIGVFMSALTDVATSGLIVFTAVFLLVLGGSYRRVAEKTRTSRPMA